jgi:hypothetical protein
MDINFEKDELKELVLSSYDLMLSIEDLNKNYVIQSKSKLKNLPEALREFDDASSSIVHFVKSAAYFLPRSDAKLNTYLTQLLDSVRKIQEKENDPERVKEKIRYLIGYSNWSMDAVCYIFTKSENDADIRMRLKNMVGAELKMLDSDEHIDEVVDEVVNKLMKWKANAGNNRRH